MKKRILSLAAAACLILSLAACGGGGAPAEETPSSAPASESPVQESTPAPAETTPAQDDSGTGLSSLEDYMNSEIMQSTLASTVEQYEAQGMGVNIYAEGDELRYEFTISDLETTEDDRAIYTESLQAGMEATADTFRSMAAQIKAAVTNDEVIVVVTYLDGAGNELLSQSFSSNDA